MLSQLGSGESEKSCQSLSLVNVGVVVTLRKYDQEEISLDASWACQCVARGNGVRVAALPLRRRARRGAPQAASLCGSGL